MKTKRFVTCIFIALITVALSSCGGGAPQAPSATVPPPAIPSPGPSETAVPTSAPTSTPTAAPTPMQITRTDNTVKTGQAAVLQFGWGAATAAQEQDFLDAVKVTMKINGQPVEGDFKAYWDPISKSESGGYLVHWTYPLADNPVFLKPGTYKVVVDWTFGEDVFDGTNTMKKGDIARFTRDVNIVLEARAERTLPLTKMKQVYVPAGEFTMGSDAETALPNAKPAHKVRLDAFWIDQTEVTNGMYMACIGAGACTTPEYSVYKGAKTKADIGSPSKRKQAEGSFTAQEFDAPDAAEYPVVDVSWEQAQAFCTWAGAALPTEAQWEKAARGTDGRSFPWGEALPSGELINSRYGQPARVGRFLKGASPYGALDMAGNVWEFVADWYGRDYYRASPADNPRGPNQGFAHVIRGGSYAVDPAGQAVTTYNRNFEGGPGLVSHVGFRCASSDNIATAGGSSGVPPGQSTPAPAPGGAAAQPAPRFLPAIPIEYGETKSSIPKQGTQFYSFEGTEGDNVEVRLVASIVRKDSWCNRRPASSFLVRTDRQEILETVGVSSNPSTTKNYRLPYSGTYYIYATCTGQACVLSCVQLDLGLERK